MRGGRRGSRQEGGARVVCEGSIPLQELNEKNQLRECPFETKKGKAYVI